MLLGFPSISSRHTCLAMTFYNDILTLRDLKQFNVITPSYGAAQVVLVVKSLPANTGDKEMQVQSLGQEDALEDEMATHSSILAWKIPWTEKSGGLQSIGTQKVARDWSNSTYSLITISVTLKI